MILYYGKWVRDLGQRFPGWFAVADAGEGPGGPAPQPPYEARRVEKDFGDRASPLSLGLDDRPSPSLTQGLDRALVWVVLTGVTRNLNDHCSRCPPKRSHKSLRRKFVPIFPVVYRLVNEETM